MKGLFVAQQLEFRLEVPTERPLQGSEVGCYLTVKNRGSQSISLSGIYVTLALGDLKKVKARSEGAFSHPYSIHESNAELVPGGEQRFELAFKLDQNAAITTKSESLFLLFGCSSVAEASSSVLLTVLPDPRVNGLLEAMESFFQFVRKGEASDDGWLEAKLAPPSTPKFAAIEELLLGIRFEAQDIALRFKFKVKRLISAGTTSMKVAKKKVELHRKLLAAEYLLSGGYVSAPAVEAAVESALSELSAME